VKDCSEVNLCVQFYVFHLVADFDVTELSGRFDVSSLMDASVIAKIQHLVNIVARE